jgi:hypothetical protein
LTPEDKLRPDEDTVCYQHDSNNQFPHHLVVECNDMMLTSAEALAFARQLPEVQALVQDLQEAITIYKFQRKQWYARTEDQRTYDSWTRRIDILTTHLIPFEEVE